MARLTTSLDALLRVRPHERAPLLWLMLYATAALGGVLTIGFAVATALFLGRLPASATALMFVVTGAAVTIAILLYNRLSARIRLAPLVIASSLLLALLALLFRGLLATPAGERLWLLLLLNLFAEVAFTLVIMQFWSYAAQVFDPRQARRLFGILTLGGTAANMVAGLLLSVLVGLIGTANLLYGVGASLLVCALCAAVLRAWLPATTERSAESSLAGDLRSIARTPLLRSIGALTVLVSLLVNIVAYQFFLALQDVFRGRDDAITVYLGRFEFAAGLAALLLHLFVSRRLIRDRGIFLALLVFPLAVLLGSGWVLATGGSLLAIALVFAAEPVLLRTFGDAAMNVLFLPLSPALRSRSKELMEVLAAAALFASGVLFLIVQRLPGWRNEYWSYPLLLLAIVWWLLSAGVRRDYLQALGESLRFRRLVLDGGTLDLSDETSVAVMRRALHDPSPPRVLHALSLIAHSSDERWGGWLRPLLRHDSPVVRRETLALLRSRQALESEDAAGLLDDPDVGVRAVAAEILSELRGAEALPLLAPLFEAESEVRIGAITGALLWGGAEGRTQAAPRLEALSTSPDPGERVCAAEIAGRLTGGQGAAALVRLLRDPDPAVRCRAARSAAAVRRPELLPGLIDALAHPATAAEASEALIAHGDQAGAALQQAFSESDLAPAARIRVLSVLAALPSGETEAFLLARIDDGDPEVRSALYRALAGMPQGPDRVALLEARLPLELREVYRTALLRSDLRLPAEATLLNEVLGRRIERGLGRLLWLCAALWPDTGLEVFAVSGIDIDDPRLLEMVDVALPSEVRPLLLPLFEGSEDRIAEVAGGRWDLPRRSPERCLAELAAEDGWLGACALYEIGARGHRTLEGSVVAALGARSPLLRETALAAVRQLHDDARLERAARPLLADPDPTVRAYAAGIVALREER